MNALLICPSSRPAVSCLGTAQPLVLAPFLGKHLIEYWLEYLVTVGVTQVIVSASDRPDQIRAVVGEGRRWRLKLSVRPETRELTPEQACAKYCLRMYATPSQPPEMLIIADHLPGRPGLRLFESYEKWFAAMLAWMPAAAATPRIGWRETEPGVWRGLRSRVAPSAKLIAPCWIGENALIGPDAVIGPHAVIENGAVVEAGARVTDSVVGPTTFVGRMTLVANSLARGSMLINWKNNSCLHVADPFLLSPLDAPAPPVVRPSLVGRIMALAVMALTLPFAMGVIAMGLLFDEPVFRSRMGVRPGLGRQGRREIFTYHELCRTSGWLRRWPQLWAIARGDLAWVGNRPLSPAQAAQLANDFERLWLAAPAGLISLADVEGCGEGVNPVTCSHASYYAVRSTFRMRCAIFFRAIRRAVLFQPLPRPTPADTGLSLQPVFLKEQA